MKNVFENQGTPISSSPIYIQAPTKSNAKWIVGAIVVGGVIVVLYYFRDNLTSLASGGGISGAKTGEVFQNDSSLGWATYKETFYKPRVVASLDLEAKSKDWVSNPSSPGSAIYYVTLIDANGIERHIGVASFRPDGSISNNWDTTEDGVKFSKLGEMAGLGLETSQNPAERSQLVSHKFTVRYAPEGA